MDTTTRSKPIKLLNTNVITRKGYYDCVITSAGFRDQEAEPKLVVGFEVVKGRGKARALTRGTDCLHLYQRLEPGPAAAGRIGTESFLLVTARGGVAEPRARERFLGELTALLTAEEKRAAPDG